MNRVIVFEELRDDFDLIDVESRFGKVHVLFKREDRRPSIMRPTEFGEAVAAKLTEIEFDYRSDKIALVGSALAFAFGLAVAYSTYPRLDLIVFDRRGPRYSCVSMETLP